MKRVKRVARLGPAMLVLALLACGGGGGGGGLPVPLPIAPVFQHEGLSGRIVNRIYSRSGRLYAATDDGLHSKTVGQSIWGLTGLAGRRVADLAFVDDGHWLAATFATGANPFADPRLLETLDGGATWAEVANNFGGGANQSEGMYALIQDAVDQRLYATGTSALASSSDFGRTWQLLDGAWDVLSHPLDALALNPATRQVWLGGQNAIEEMELRRYDIATMNVVRYQRLLPSPATIKGITFDPSDGSRVLASGEGGVLQTRNNGSNWTNLLPGVGSRFYFQTALDPVNPMTIYTAGWDKIFDDPQPLIFEISHNGGSSWQQHAFNDPQLFGGVWSVLAIRESGQTVVYLGLYRGGIMKVTLPAG